MATPVLSLTFDCVEEEREAGEAEEALEPVCSDAVNVRPVTAVPVESARCVRIEMVSSPDGPSATAESVHRGMAWGSAFMYAIDGANYLVTARHNLTGRHWRTGGYLGRASTEPTHLKAV